MNYREAVQYIESLSLNTEKRPSLERIEKFLFCNDSPQNKFKSMHVAGTNGKGSTVAMVASILRTGGLKTGRFIGPHLLRLNERFHINGQPITDDELAKQVTRLKEKNDRFAKEYPVLGSLSWFEFLTAIAFFYFADNSVEAAAIEVGLGGRYDATNVLKNIYASGITNIAFDHERILGSSLEEIAAEKAGIIKPGVPIVTGASGVALKVIAEKAKQLNSPLMICNSENNYNFATNKIMGASLKQIEHEICRHGLYQYDNSALALNLISTAGLFDSESSDNGKQIIVLEKALDALKNLYWPGRFQIVHSENLVLDCAHNPACIQSLRNSLDALLGEQPFHFIFACYSDKDGATMVKSLLTPGDYLYLVEPLGLRPFFPNEALANIAEEIGVSAILARSIADALLQAKAKRKKSEYIVATGSFSVIKTVMENLGWRTVEDGIK